MQVPPDVARARDASVGQPADMVVGRERLRLRVAHHDQASPSRHGSTLAPRRLRRMPNGPSDGDDATPPNSCQSAATGPGPLIAIGGAEDKLGRRTVLKTFVALAGGSDAKIAVVPTASIARARGRRGLRRAVPQARGTRRRRRPAAEPRGGRGPRRRQPARRRDRHLHDRRQPAEALRRSSTARRSGRPSGQRTSAASSSAAPAPARASSRSHMVAFGTGGTTPKQRMTQLAAGLGLVRDVVIDQHFAQRNRYGRLLMLVAQSPGLLGIGVDEDTGAVITEEDGVAAARRRRPRRGDDLRRPQRGVQRPRGPSHRSAAGLRRGAARAARRAPCSTSPTRSWCGRSRSSTPARPRSSRLRDAT